MAMVPAGARRSSGSAWDWYWDRDGVSQFVPTLGSHFRIRMHRQTHNKPAVQSASCALGKQAVITLLRVCNILFTILIPVLGVLWLL
jgi:hypothetical protein